MKIKTTTTTTKCEIECNAEELRQSNDVSGALTGALRRMFNGPVFGADEESYPPEEEESENE